MVKLSQEITDSICNKLKELLPDKEIIASKVIKNNDLELTGITIRNKNCNIAPTIYVEHFIEDINNINIDYIATEILKCYHEHYDEYLDITHIQNYILDYEKAKPSLRIRLISKEKNEKKLKDIPYHPFLDMAIVVVIEQDYLNGTSTFVQVTHELLNIWGKDNILEILPVAKKNTFNISYTLMSIADLIFDTEAIESEDIKIFKNLFPMWVLTNKQRIYGAAEICNTMTMNHLTELFDSDLYVLPSSTHECIIVPTKIGAEPEYLVEMVRAINQKEVPHDEILSDNVYVYSKKNGWIIIK